MDNKTKNRPTIAHVVSYYPPHIGGMQKVAQEVSTGLAQKNWPVEVITSNIGASNDSAVEKKSNFVINRLKSIEFAHTPIMRGLLRKLFSLPKKSVIHLHIAQVLVPEAVWLVSKIRRIPYIAHFHLDVGPSGPLGFLFLIYKKLFLGIVLREANLVIVTSQKQADLIRRKYFVESHNIAIIPNGVSEPFFEFRPRRLPKSKLKLLFVGRLSVQKRVDRLLEALAITKAPVELTIVGDGEKRESLEKQAETLGLKNVNFVGAKTDHELIKFYQGADVFVLPSDREAGMPLVLLEAMANGLPVIGADVLGIAEFIGKSGILADPNPESFAQALDDLWQKKAKLSILSDKSKIKAKKYSWNNLVKKVEPLYKTVYKESNHRLKAPQVGLIFNRSWLLITIFLWGFLFLSFGITNLSPLILNVIGFSFLLFIPGILTFLIFRPPRDLSSLGKLALVIAFSLLELIGTTLLSNTFLPLFGVARPLDPIPLAVAITVLILGLLVISWTRLKNWSLDFNSLSISHFKGIDWFASLFPLVFIFMSVMGAISLNNGGTNVVTIVMLIGIGAYFVWLVSKGEKLKNDAILIAMYFLGLSLLLMTSMRGWYATGHDIHREFNVFMIAKNHGIWNVGYYQDAYNACLSITLLPTIFANLLRIPDPYVFKVFFQIIFAVTPAIVFLMVQRYLKPSLAIIAAFWFIAFPTYFSDMPMLNRQEIAFLFLALMLWIVFEPKFKVLTRQSYIVVFGSSIALLHYSTMYSVIFILMFSIILRWLLPILKSIGRQGIFNQSSISELSNEDEKIFSAKPILTFPILLILIGSIFVWGTLITKTSTHATEVITQSISNIPNLLDNDKRFSNAPNNLLSWKIIDNQEVFNEYIEKVVKPKREHSRKGEYFNEDIANSYPVKIINKDEVVPLSKVGQTLKKLGIDLAAFNFIFRQAIAKVLQILIILGFICLIYRNKYLLKNKIDAEFIILAAGSLLFVLLLVVLPGASSEYGQLRAFQQTLMILSLLLVIGSLLIAFRIEEKLKVVFATSLAVIFFLSSTGLITQALGGYYPQLNLNNSGMYYDLYYLHRSEVLGSKWISSYSGKTNNKIPEIVQFDYFDLVKIAPYAAFRNVNVLGYIYPSLIKKDAYVFLGPLALNRKSSFDYQGAIIPYVYPLGFLNKEKDLIYSNSGVRVYK